MGLARGRAPSGILARSGIRGSGFPTWRQTGGSRKPWSDLRGHTRTAVRPAGGPLQGSSRGRESAGAGSRPCARPEVRGSLGAIFAATREQRFGPRAGPFRDLRAVGDPRERVPDLAPDRRFAEALERSSRPHENSGSARGRAPSGIFARSGIRGSGFPTLRQTGGSRKPWSDLRGHTRTAARPAGGPLQGSSRGRGSAGAGSRPGARPEQPVATLLPALRWWRNW